MQRLEYHHKQVIDRDLFSKFGYLELQKNKSMQIKKICLHISLGGESKTTVKDPKLLKSKVYKGLVGLELLAATKARLHFCKKAVGEIQLRKGSLSGVSVNLTNSKIYSFLDQLVTQVLPTLRPFDNLKKDGLDQQGNFNFRLRSILSFPNIQQIYQKFSNDFETETTIEISFICSPSKKEKSLVLYSAFQLPFENLLNKKLRINLTRICRKPYCVYSSVGLEQLASD